MCYGIPLAAACGFESDHHALRNVGQGHVVLEEGGEEEGSTRSRVDRRSHNAAAIHVEIDPQGRRFNRRQTNFVDPNVRTAPTLVPIVGACPLLSP